MQKPEPLDYEPRKPNLADDMAFLFALFAIFGVVAVAMWLMVER